MAKSVVERITDELLARLADIKVANGYSFDSGVVRLVTRNTNDYSPQPKDIFCDQKEEQRNEELSYPGMPAADAYGVEYQIYGYINQLDETGRKIETIDRGIDENTMTAAIKQAIADNDPIGWQTFAGNSFNAAFIGGGPLESPGNDAVGLVLAVQYRVSQTDPSQIR